MKKIVSISLAMMLSLVTCDSVSDGERSSAEEYLGGYSKRILPETRWCSSKVYFNEGRLSKTAILQEIDGSLKRLGTDYLDLYIIHRFDYDTPIEETMEALHDLIKAGKVRALGALAMYLPVLQYADDSKAARLDAVLSYGEPL